LKAVSKNSLVIFAFSNFMAKFTLIVLFVYMTLNLSAQKILSSPRSVDAIQRVKPFLEKELNKAGFRWGSKILIRIIKQDNALEVWLKNTTRYELFKTYKICYFSGEIGPKTKQGDNQAPEGFYEIRPAQMNPNSSYHLAFNLGYPNAYDKAHQYTGDYLMVHGNCVSIGCYAMTDPKIEEIYALMQAAFENNQKMIQVHCFPFKMTNENLAKYKGHKYEAFWQNIAEGYRFFEQNHQPPKVNVKNKKYVFE
jgi:murein L,D-transpeptidase YafK